MSSLLKIDGAKGEGGGQILRSSLALSMATGQAIQIENIRAKRPKPGLMRQHLTCVLAAQKICNAQVDGAYIGSTEIHFTPSTVQAGDYTFAIGSAGSTMLVLQTVLPALMLAKGASSVRVEGGTHNPQAPPFEHFAHTFLPQLNKMGMNARATIEAYGFCPAGGGRVHMDIEPAKKLNGLSLLSRGVLQSVSARILLAGDLHARIGEKQLALVKEETHWQDDQLRIEVVPSIGPGNALLLQTEHEHITETFSALGAFERSSFQVVEMATRPLLKYLASDVPVAEHLTDQLMLPMALAAMQGEKSTFRTRGLSLHATTHAALIEQFLGIQVRTAQEGVKCVRVEIG